MNKNLLGVSLALILFSGQAFGQERTVTGKVTSTEDGAPMPGVNVYLKESTTVGTLTDTDGRYSLSVPSSTVSIVFSFIGFQSEEILVGDKTVIDIGLTEDVTQLSEVVVTALGVEREQKALGFAQTTISAAALANKPETDIGRALQGRTPGLQIQNSSGLAGAGTKINIRGNSSITGNTQPLWVVNGVPINTDANDVNSDFRDGQVAPTRFLDIDPNNIESISVLRGLSATTLYGSQGRNGVILVTTKTGSTKNKQNGFEGSLSQSYFVVQAILPEYQNKWANGYDGAYGEFFSNWGSLFNGKPQAGWAHPYYEHAALFPNHPEFAQSDNYIPKAAPNNVKDFFQLGSSSTTSLNLGARTDFGSINFNYSHLNENGFIKNNNLKRDNFSLGGTAKLTDRLVLSNTFNYVVTDFKTPPTGAGDGSTSYGGPSVFSSLFFTPRSIDLMNWPYENPITHENINYRSSNDIINPRWLLENSQQTDVTNRFFSSSSLNLKILDWISATYRLGWDTYSERQTYWLNKGTGAGLADGAPQLGNGAYRSTTGKSSVFDHTFLLTFDRDLSPDLNLTALAGSNFRENKYTQEGLESLGQVAYGLIEHRNFTSTLPRDFRGNNLNYQRNSAIAGVYFDATVEYKKMLYVNLSGRNDWSSTLQKENRSQFYPGGSIAFIPTAAFPNFATDILDFLKVRVAYGSSANFGLPYNTQPYLTLNAQNRVDKLGNSVTSRLPSLLANPKLKPELLTEIEFGIESQLFNNRIKLDMSFYRKVSKDQIIERPLDPSTGYLSTYINAGTISNKGIELSLTGTPLKTNAWTLDITTNITKNVSKVESLPDGSKTILIDGFSNLGNFAIEGKPMNVIQGTYAERTPDGRYIIDENGNYKIASEIGIIANPNPKWIGSVITSLSWKGFSLGMQWDYVHGGQVFSFTAATMIGRGVSKDLEDFDPTLPLILPGVQEVTDGDGNVTGYTRNNIPITTAEAFFTNGIIGGGASDRGVFDATRVRFREISLGYNIPKNIVSVLKVRGINISFVGNNLWYRAINAPKYAKADFDRTAFGTSNGSGFDYLGGPSARRFGVNVKVNF
jgi:TonB-linked SusC/RagA family outer membrane protein